MSGASPLPPDRVPTLTEVVDWPETAATPLSSGESQAAPHAGDTGEPLRDAPVAPPAADAPAAPPAPAAAAPERSGSIVGVNDAELSERVLAEVQRQIDLMLDYRLREVLTPLLSRLADNLVRETRAELASTLREVVTRAVAQELARHRVR